MKTKKRAGWVLSEIIMGVVILGIIATLAAAKAPDIIDDFRSAKAQSEVNSIAIAIQRYKTEVGSYPTNLGALTTKNGVFGPWLKLPASDSWGSTTTINGTGGGSSPYCYAYTANGFAVWSLGKNKTNNSGGAGTTLPSAIGGDDIGLIEN